MSNRHVHNSAQEVWESYEWLIRQRLEDLDNLSREMFKDMRLARINTNVAYHVISQSFADLWAEVAEENRISGEQHQVRRERLARDEATQKSS
ncbi:hypothetical protein [Cohnella abietis]|uniref:Uncharacterized protein n=1 Tax=Cohnella abietis TaxID=2507935 RepID=A0A3T1D338_9BACL|nr:hypothetical protein [Cohnella abietis]BBI32458.1 hypothetical protein KCTCHS21_18570 [Cohnella abietis]